MFGSDAVLTALIATTALICLVVMVARGVALKPSRDRDPIRRFSHDELIEVVSRAGGRCEHHDFLGRRCEATTGLHADHVHPHSKGGQTSLANAAALCAWHNMKKGARVPYDWEIQRLEARRVGYFPPGVPRGIVRRGSRSQHTA
ncbi:HNH endonuclease [Jatrophihabitans sp. GAS493]|uniref:HNH endonuclease n=1 Tax=Jatrophihabitans sp. GAS493 TaxID=1907575 RepID=UPI000BB8F1A4|nr:HNH endonuclease [Jatrophihabitans sp. GAS493]SOD71131.1 HNH endonuclease [Jatrophihabitans sp. GAS493]